MVDINGKEIQEGDTVRFLTEEEIIAKYGEFVNSRHQALNDSFPYWGMKVQVVDLNGGGYDDYFYYKVEAGGKSSYGFAQSDIVELVDLFTEVDDDAILAIIS